MKTYLGFKRTVNKLGILTSEIKFVPVNIPEIDPSEGWKLVGTSDVIQVLSDTKTVTVSGPCIGEQLTIEGMDVPVDSEQLQITRTELQPGSSFESLVVGTAKLIRANGDIFIAYRKGKKALNETSPNSVCISEFTKSQFFEDCRRAYGRSCDHYRFSSGCNEFDYWNKFMDREYSRQLEEVNKKQS